MSKPAARIGDMHTCPMATPGSPPVPHVGGPVTGPGVTTVLIGGMPAAVMGDMCTCTGPPDSIVMGSTGVLIGGKPAARLGDMTSHGGSIVAGCPSVLIGEVSAGAPPANVAALLDNIDSVPDVIKSTMTQVMQLKNAAVNGLPFCEVVENDPENESNSEVKEINAIFFADQNGNPISEVTDEKSVFLVIESQNLAGQDVIVGLHDHSGDFTFQGQEIENNELTITLSGDQHSIELGVKLNAN